MKANKVCLRNARLYCHVILMLCFVATSNPSSVLANDGDKQPAPERPVARLITRVRGANSRPAGAASKTITNRPRSTTVAVTSTEMRAFDLLNAERRAKNLPPLEWNAELCFVARAHSAKMALSGKLNHQGMDGLDTSARARANGITGWRALGENIAYNQGSDDPVAFAVERWMLSAKHRANILNNSFTHAGVGVAQAADGSFYFTQVFIAR